MSLIDNDTDVRFTLDDFDACKRLVSRKAAEWKPIAIELGLQSDSIDCIKEDNQFKCTQCLDTVLGSWLKQNILKHRRRGGPKLSQLVEAIEPVDYAFAEGLLENFKAMKQKEKEQELNVQPSRNEELKPEAVRSSNSHTKKTIIDEEIISELKLDEAARTSDTKRVIDEEISPETLDKRDEQTMDGSTSPIPPQNPPSPERIESNSISLEHLPTQFNKLKMLVVYTQNEQSMFREALPRELRYKPPSKTHRQPESPTCNCLNVPAKQTEIKVFINCQKHHTIPPIITQKNLLRLEKIVLD